RHLHSQLAPDTGVKVADFTELGIAQARYGCRLRFAAKEYRLKSRRKLRGRNKYANLIIVELRLRNDTVITRDEAEKWRGRQLRIPAQSYGRQGHRAARNESAGETWTSQRANGAQEWVIGQELAGETLVAIGAP